MEWILGESLGRDRGVNVEGVAGCKEKDNILGGVVEARPMTAKSRGRGEPCPKRTSKSKILGAGTDATLDAREISSGKKAAPNSKGSVTGSRLMRLESGGWPRLWISPGSP